MDKRCLAFCAGFAGLALSGIGLSLSCGARKRRATSGLDLSRLGHRNWIIIADAAYPDQVSPGMDTVWTGAEAIETLERVLEAMRRAGHVQPAVFLDAELPHVGEEDARGIHAYRARLALRLEGLPVASHPHEEIIARLDEDARTFRVLVLKTTLALPYTSVFIRLECGYWNAGAESRLRASLLHAASGIAEDTAQVR